MLFVTQSQIFLVRFCVLIIRKVNIFFQKTIIIKEFYLTFSAMGLSFSKLFDKLVRKRELKLLMLGIDSAGKTTILYKLKLGEVVSSVPTIGFNVETIEYKSTSIISWDVGGGMRIKPIWRQYYPETQGIIFVVDSSDKDRIEIAKEELDSLLSEELLKDAVLLVLANKQDISGVLSVTEIAEMFDLTTLKNREWHIQGTCAKTGEGLYAGFEWLTQTISKKRMSQK